jgi:hypothetical protein
MLTYPELVRLERSLRATRVLTVYIDGSATDPAPQRNWRAELDRALGDLRAKIGGALREEREQFSSCVRMIEEQLAPLARGIGAPGWAAFVTPSSVRYAERVAAHMPTMAAWAFGACVSPYIHALKESRPVVVAVLDPRKAVLYRYRFGRLDQIETLHAHYVTGMQGATGRDAQRSEFEGMNRMLDELVERALAHAGQDGCILLGGIPRVVSHALGILGPVTPRVLPLESLHVYASAAEIAEAARVGAATLRRAWDSGEVEAVAASAQEGSLGVIGTEATARALALACVAELYVSPAFLEQHATEAELALRRAFDQDALVEEVSRDAAEQLDAVGGIAARLRHRPPGERGVDTDAATNELLVSA